MLYSTNEVTYKTEIVDLLKKLKEFKIDTKEVVFDFPEHELIGPVFSNYLKEISIADNNPTT